MKQFKSYLSLMVIIITVSLSYVYSNAQIQEPQDTSIVKWRLDMEDENGIYWNHYPFWFTPDSQFVYHQKYPTGKDSLHDPGFYNKLIKRDLVTGEIAEEREIDFRIGSFKITDDMKYLIVNPFDDNTRNVFVYNLNSMDLVQTITVDKYEALGTAYSQEEIDAAGEMDGGSIYLPHDGQHVLIHYSFPDAPYKSVVPHQMMCLFDIETGNFIKEIYATNRPDFYRHANVHLMRYSKDGKYLFVWEVFDDFTSHNNNNDIRIWHTDNYDSTYRIGANYQSNIHSIFYIPRSESLIVNYQGSKKESPDFILYDIKRKEIKKEFVYQELGWGYITAVSNNNRYIIFRGWFSFDNGLNYLIDLETEELIDIPDGHPDKEQDYLPRYAFWLENQNMIIYYGPHESTFVAIGFDLDEVTYTPYEILSDHGDLYPNPGEDHINIPLNNDRSEIKIYNSNLKLVDRISGKKNSGNMKIDISKLPAGQYFIVISSDSNKVTNYQFIKK